MYLRPVIGLATAAVGVWAGAAAGIAPGAGAVTYRGEGRRSRVLRIGLATLAGGAAANLAERLLAGDVVDYPDLYIGPYHWPTFTLADVAIKAGIALLFLDAWLERRSASRLPAAG
jgi:signal peptidase II